jgi:gliding motility-associated-like protein
MTFRILIFLCLFLGTRFCIQGQFFVVNGGQLYSSSNSIAQCNGGFSVENNGVVNCNGQLTITKNSTFSQQGNLLITNGSSINNSGTIRIEQDMWNDGSFSNNQSVVEFFGNTNQQIGSNNGTVTTFHNLHLTGNAAVRTKELVNADIQISNAGSLQLNDRILHTHAQTLHVFNDAVNTITNLDLGLGFGFIASDLSGYLRWKGLNGLTYLAPTGSVSPSDLYRPILYTPSGNDFFKSRLDQHNATIDGLSLGNHSNEICEANAKFYHRFLAEGSSFTDFNLSFDPSQDGTWSSVAEYVNLWIPTGLNTNGVNSGLNWLNVANSNYDVNEEAFVLTNSAPVANFSVNSLDLFYNQVQFTDNSTGANSWSWDFDDNTNSSVQNPEHTFWPGDYQVLLTASNDFGCTDTATAWIHSGGSILIPNIFSPDSDSFNDTYLVQVPPVEYFHLIIFTRWGTIVFESFDSSIQWDGTYEGNDCTEGVYFSVLELKQGNYQDQYEGTIELVRKQ